MPDILAYCRQCPRKCASKWETSPNTDLSSTKSRGSLNYCGKSGDSSLFQLFPFAKSMQHFWEEPCISGTSGSGAIFFSGCNLGCSFCQNYEISNPKHSKFRYIDSELLEAEIFRLKNLGCHNINFVTGSHLITELLPILRNTVSNGIDLPMIWNSSAYETVNQLKSLEPFMDVYLPDLKFYSPALSGRVANAPDYFKVAVKAVLEMVRQRPENQYSTETEINKVKNSITGDINRIKKSTTGDIDNIKDLTANNIDYIKRTSGCNYNTKSKQNQTNTSQDIHDLLIKKGVVIRHLVLPGFYQDSIKILEWIDANLSNQVTLSLLSQYIPDYYETACKANGYDTIPSLKRKLTTFEYEKVVDKAILLGFKDVYIQERDSAKKEYVPDFKCNGMEWK